MTALETRFLQKISDFLWDYRVLDENDQDSPKMQENFALSIACSQLFDEQDNGPVLEAMHEYLQNSV